MLEIITPEQTDIVTRDWYKLLVDDCKAIITEAVFNSRWALVEGYHMLGERIVTEHNLDRREIYGKKIAQGLAQSIGLSERTINYAVQFYDKYPDLSTVPEGKNITWNKIVTKYLPTQKEDDGEQDIYDDISDYVKLMREYAEKTFDISESIENRRVAISPTQARYLYDQTALMYGLWDNLRHQLYSKTGMEKT